MQYHEFLRKGGFTMDEVSFHAYSQYIEKAYMERDSLFPDQESVISHFKATGICGFTKHVLDSVDALRKAITNLRQVSFDDDYNVMLDLALRTAELPPRLKN